MVANVADLARRFRVIERDRMRGLPICNSRLHVEAVGFRELDGGQLGMLVTPWFMNLVLLPGLDDACDCEPGSVVERSLPSGRQEFTACRDEELGVYYTAVMFRSVMDFPDQTTARAIAGEIMAQLFTEAANDAIRLSRRKLFPGVGAL